LTSTPGKDEIAIEVLPRLETVLSDRWPIHVAPARDELLSSWLHRIASAHGLSPRRFGASLGFEERTWSARLDNAAPDWLFEFLYTRTGLPVDRIASMTIGFEPWYPLALSMRWRPHRSRATWLQFCPSCLAEDKHPHFRRRWRRATFIVCPTHQIGLIDRCTACGSGIVSCDERAIVPQHRCAECGFDLRRAKGIVLSKAARRASKLLDGLVAAECARGILSESSLIEQILELPSLLRPNHEVKFTSLSSRARLRCLEELNASLDKHLMRDPDPRIAAWRRSIILSGGPYSSLEPLISKLTESLNRKKRPRNPRGKDIREIDLPQLLLAYRDLASR